MGLSTILNKRSLKISLMWVGDEFVAVWTPSKTSFTGKKKLARTAQAEAKKVPTIYKMIIFLILAPLWEKSLVQIEVKIKIKTSIGAIAFKALVKVFQVICNFRYFFRANAYKYS